MKDGSGEMERERGREARNEAKVSKIFQAFLPHPQSLAAEAARSSRDIPRVSGGRLFKARILTSPVPVYVGMRRISATLRLDSYREWSAKRIFRMSEPTR